MRKFLTTIAAVLLLGMLAHAENNVSAVPYSFTSSMDASFSQTTGALPKKGPYQLSFLYWSAPASAGDSFTVVDGQGATIATFTATAATVSQGYFVFTFSPSRTVSDFRITTLASGTLYVYTGASAGSGITSIGSLTSGKLLTGNGGSGIKADSGCSTDGSGNLTCASFNGSGTGPAMLSGSPGTCSLSSSGEGKLCLRSTINRYQYSYNGGPYSDLSGGTVPCSVGLWNSGVAIPVGSYSLSARCMNVYGVSYSIAGIKCYSDNSGTSSASAADSSSNALLTSAVTASPTWGVGTQSATTSIANGAWTNWTLTSDGASTTIQCVMTTVH